MLLPLVAALLGAATLRLEPCQVPGVPEALRCGTLEVPENRSAPRGRRIGLRIVIVPAKEPTPGAAPLFHLEGGQRVDLFGLSYGTRLALVYMRRHPDRVRSAVLMGPAPTDLAMPLHHAPDGQRALDLLLSDCAADPGCHRAFPRLREDLQAVLERLDQAPVAVSLPRAPGAPPSTYHLTRGAFAEQVRTRLYAPSSRRSLPLAIHAASQGDFEPFL